ncbi:unnamed protein product [Ranitomeya imitator]|uniref:Reverse transcriptase domain-containing protein n=1 Tax=Ranitomeya imitator TaxID=111125 RepID=A0ABN9ML15_9NEOB|nr:unnamed protein product [Ranitomeya imitator]
MELGVFQYTTEEEERVLGGIDGEAFFFKTPSTLELKRKYESDVKRVVNLQLHMMTLGQYYKEGKIPRGLRSGIRPNLFQGNATYCARFVMISNKYAMDTILLNIDFLQTEIKKLQVNISESEGKIQALLTVDEWNVFKEKVDKESVKLRNDLEEIKRRKWNRDLEDYEMGHVYTWQKDSSKSIWKKKGGGNNNHMSNVDDKCTNNDTISHRPGEWYGRTFKRKRRGGKRHHRYQKKIRKEQITATETSNLQEKGSELVINISNKVLTPTQISILSRGLSFSPCTHTKWFDLQIDMERFFRTIKLKEWFHDKSIVNRTGNSEFDSKSLGLRQSSDFVPPANSAIIDAFERAVRRDIEEIRDGVSEKFKHPNISSEEYMALQELVHDDDIIIKPADKGGAVVIMDRLKYIAEINRQLRDEMVYQRLDGDPKFGIMGEINDCLKEALDNEIIDQELKNYLSIEFPRTPVLYITPKIHKSLVDPPGRPIVSGVDSVFSRIGTFLDKILNPIAKKSKSYIQDTTDFLNKLEAVKFESEVILASFDVISLYTSIEHSSGIKAVEAKLNSLGITVIGKAFLIKLLDIILRRSYFLFGDTFYSQKRGPEGEFPLLQTLGTMRIPSDTWCPIDLYWYRISVSAISDIFSGIGRYYPIPILSSIGRYRSTLVMRSDAGSVIALRIQSGRCKCATYHLLTM